MNYIVGLSIVMGLVLPTISPVVAKSPDKTNSKTSVKGFKKITLEEFKAQWAKKKIDGQVQGAITKQQREAAKKKSQKSRAKIWRSAVKTVFKSKQKKGSHAYLGDFSFFKPAKKKAVSQTNGQPKPGNKGYKYSSVAEVNAVKAAKKSGYAILDSGTYLGSVGVAFADTEGPDRGDSTGGAGSVQGPGRDVDAVVYANDSGDSSEVAPSEAPSTGSADFPEHEAIGVERGDTDGNGLDQMSDTIDDVMDACGGDCEISAPNVSMDGMDPGVDIGLDIDKDGSPDVWYHFFEKPEKGIPDYRR